MTPRLFMQYSFPLNISIKMQSVFIVYDIQYVFYAYLRMTLKVYIIGSSHCVN